MRIASSIILSILIAVVGQAQDKPQSWISTSNEFTKQLVKVENKHDPENGSRQGLSEYDELVSQPTLADEDQERKEGRSPRQAQGGPSAAEAEGSGAGSGNHHPASRAELPPAGISARPRCSVQQCQFVGTEAFGCCSTSNRRRDVRLQ